MAGSQSPSPPERHSRSQNHFDQNLVQYAALAGAAMALFTGGRRGGVRGTLFTLLGSGILYSVARGHMPRLEDLPILNSIPRQVHLQSIVNIDRSAEEIYRFWRDFPQLQQSMSYVKHIKEKEPGHTHWVVQGPRGPALVWESEVTEDIPNRRIAWRSLAGSQIHNEGSVEFRERGNGRGTDVAVNLLFEPPGGTIGAAVGRFMQELENSLLTQNLYDLKAQLEAGEVPTNQRVNRSQTGQHSGEPPASAAPAGGDDRATASEQKTPSRPPKGTGKGGSQ